MADPRDCRYCRNARVVLGPRGAEFRQRTVKSAIIDRNVARAEPDHSLKLSTSRHSVALLSGDLCFCELSVR